MLQLQRLPWSHHSLRPQRSHVTSRLPLSSTQHCRRCRTAALAPSYNASNASQDDSTSNASKPAQQQENEQQQQQQQPEKEKEPTTTPFPPQPDQQPQGSAKATNLADGPIRRTPRGGGDETPPEPPGPPPLPPQLQRLLLLLTEFGGIYGTAAVVIAWFTHVDPFGGLHWDTNHVLFGIQTFLPIIALDALLMLPDYSIGPEDSQEVAGMFFGDPNALRNWDGSVQVTPGAAESMEGASATAADTSAAAAATGASTGTTTAAASAASSSSSSKPAENPVLKLRMALQLLQQVYTRANPGAALSPLAELGVVCVACLADEMLYRAVGLTLVGLWLRDRMYEAGFDETVTLSLLNASKELPTPEFARYAAVALIASLGIAGFAAGALREIESIKRLQVLDKDGSASEATETLKAQLVASLGSQNLVMYGVEGAREVTASVMAGFSFVATGNLVAPLAGSLLVQTLFSTYQRISLARTKKKRKEMLRNMKQRSDKLQAAMAAALTAKKAAAAAGVTEAEVAADTEGSSAADQVVDVADSSNSSSSSTGAVADSSSSDGDISKNENVDFLTLVLEAAAKQEEEQKRQQQQQQQRSRSSAAPGTSAATSSSTAEPASAVAASGEQDLSSSSSSNTASSSGLHEQDLSSSSSSSSSNSSSTDADAAAVATAEAARQQLSVLLEDMLRSPEGFRVVQKWMDGQNITSANGSSQSIVEKDPQKAVDQLLADPETKAKLLQELEDQLFTVSEQRQRRKKQEETWRQ